MQSNIEYTYEIIPQVHLDPPRQCTALLTFDCPLTLYTLPIYLFVCLDYRRRAEGGAVVADYFECDAARSFLKELIRVSSRRLRVLFLDHLHLFSPKTTPLVGCKFHMPFLCFIHFFISWSWNRVRRIFIFRLVSRSFTTREFQGSMASSSIK